MSNDRQDRAREIFFACLKRGTPDERAQLVRRECADDAPLESAVLNLLEVHESNDSFLERPLDSLLAGHAAGEPAATVAVPEAAEQPGTLIGPYKLLQQIGEGGFGVVYMAEQIEPVCRKVALKIIKPGMDTKDVIARFEAERQALALMDHPNVAKVLDAGATDSGRPYFVMELVYGVPITEFCDEQELSTHQRLELFINVCRAVQHAHQKGIIHRDLKPSNILVTMDDDRPMPKVIDFGISKALSQKLTKKTLFTAYGQMIGTPLYMSPEQAQLSAHDVDTRSDVYSLGVLLYELLTGTTPFDKETLQKSGLDEMRRIIREVDPPQPSARVNTLKAAALSTVSEQRGADPRKLSRALRGELDWIVMRALEKDRNRRYESASAFAADIQRYLSDEPVTACPPSSVYRLRKLARRNKIALITTVLVVTSLLVGTGVSVWQAVEASNARDLADERLELANDRLQSEKQAKEDAEEQRKLAEANFRKAREAVDQYFTLVSESTLLDEPGLQPLRLELIEAALTYYETFAARRGDDPRIQLELAATHLRLAQIYHALYRLDDSISAFEKGFALVEQTIQRQPAESEAYVALAGFWHGGRTVHGQAVQPVTDPSHALAVLRKGVGLWERFVEVHPAVPGFQTDLSKFYDVMANHQSALGQREDALHSSRRVRDIREKLVRDHPEVPEYQAELSYGYLHLAQVLEDSDPQQAKELYRRAITVQQEADFLPYRGNLARMHKAFAQFLQRHNRPDEAIEELRKETTIYVKLIEEYPHVGVFQTSLRTSQRLLADLLMETGRTDEAAHAIGETLMANPSTAGEYHQRGELYERLNEPDKALADYGKALELDDSLWPAFAARSKLNLTLQRYDEALPDLLRLVNSHNYDEHWHTLLVDCYVKLKEYGKAIAELDSRIAAEPDNANLYKTRASVYEKAEQLEEALADYEKAVEVDPSNRQTQRSLCVFLMSAASEDFRDWNRALTVAQKLVELQSDRAESWVFLARIHKELGNYEEALDAYAKAIELDDSMWPAFAERGLLYLTLQQHDKAVPDLLWTANSDRDTEHWLNRLIDCYVKLEQYDKAIAELDTRIAAEPDNANLYTTRASVNQKAERFEKALADYGKAIELDDNMWRAFANRSKLNLTLQRYDEALPDLLRLVNSRQYSEHWLNLLVDCYVNLEQCDEAIAELETRIAAEPDKANLYKTRARLCQKAGRFDEALAEYSRALELEPNAACYVGRAGIYWEQKRDSEKALADYEKAVELDPVGCWQQRGDAFSALGRYEDANREYTRVLDRNPNASWSFKRRARARFMLGLYDEALRDLTHMVELNPNTNTDLIWISTTLVAKCPDENFRKGLLELADRTVELTNGSPGAYVRRGFLKARLDNLDDALADYERGIEATEDPGLRAQHYNNAAWYLATSPGSTPRHVEKAIQWVEKAIELEGSTGAPASLYQPSQPSNLMRFLPSTDPYFARGSLYAALEMDDRARADFEKYIERLSKPVQETPDDWTVWNRRGVGYHKLDRYEDAVKDFSKAIELEADEPIVWANRGGNHAELGRWGVATADYAKAIELGGGSHYVWYQYAMLCLASEDRDGYSKACAEMLDRFAQSDDTSETHFAAWTCALAPDAVDDYSPVVKLVERTRKADPNPSFQQCLGAVLYRAGQFNDALEPLRMVADDEDPENTSPAYGWYFLAMTHHKVNNADQAADRLAKANAWTDRTLAEAEADAASLSWNRRLTLVLLRTEAEDLLSVAHPDGQPESPSEEASVPDEPNTQAGQPSTDHEEAPRHE